MFASEFVCTVCVQPAEARGGVTLEVELMVAVCHRVVLGAEPGPLCEQPLRVYGGGVSTFHVVTAV